MPWGYRWEIRPGRCKSIYFKPERDEESGTNETVRMEAAGPPAGPPEDRHFESARSDPTGDFHRPSEKRHRQIPSAEHDQGIARPDGSGRRNDFIAAALFDGAQPRSR